MFYPTASCVVSNVILVKDLCLPNLRNVFCDIKPDASLLLENVCKESTNQNRKINELANHMQDTFRMQSSLHTVTHGISLAVCLF